MNKHAKILFEMLESRIEADTSRLSKRMLKSCAVKVTAANIRRKVEAQIREALEQQVWDFLCVFDNVGCRLPDGVLGYKIVAKPERRQAGRIKHTRPVDIRDGAEDYSDMWLAFCSGKENQEKDGT